MIGSLPTRVSRAVFGLLSIWCLGCTSLDVIIDRLVHHDAAASGCVMADDAPVQGSGNGTPTMQPSVDHSVVAGCGCDHCIAVQTPATAVAVAPLPTPDAVEHRLGNQLDVAREPLVPPPIAGTI
ncbi:MAG TPA: hypothetical protein VFT29_15070, partial [Gemmatimonadaceae bacterium]|nr:hypothetical protein [Gemmatimonadaceae bacterium]